MIESKAATESGDLREGEIAVELPERFDASLYYIGRIHTPWTRREDCPKNPRETDAVCTIVLDPRWYEYADRAAALRVGGTRRFYYPADFSPR